MTNLQLKVLEEISKGLNYDIHYLNVPVEVNGTALTLGRTHYPSEGSYIEVSVGNIYGHTPEDILSHELGHVLCDIVLGQQYHSLLTSTREYLANEAAKFLHKLSEKIIT